MAKTPVDSFGYAAKDNPDNLSPFDFSRRATGERDVQLKVLYCGVCFSDVSMVKNYAGYTRYPIIPGHEIVGVATEVGSKVEKVKVGDKVGVGMIVGSCRQCDYCTCDFENLCSEVILTAGALCQDGTITRGGFSDIMEADEHFIIRWPENLPLAAGAPLLCVGITTYSPLRDNGLDKPGLRVGVNGLGVEGHLAVKFIKAVGINVTLISSSRRNTEEAAEKLSVNQFLVTSNPVQMQDAEGTLDVIIDTIAAADSVELLLSLLKPRGRLVVVGNGNPLQLSPLPLITGRKTISGSAFGGMKETQEMIDFAAKHNILPYVQVIPMEAINSAMEQLLTSYVKHRYLQTP